MKIALDISEMSGENAFRGLGVYTKFLVKYLKYLSVKESFQLSLIENRDPKELLKYDIVHYPKFDLFFPTLPFHKVIPTVVTIHDTTPLLYPKVYPPGVKGKFNLIRQKISLRKVDHVITDSETSKKDIVRNLGVVGDKVTPIYLGPTVDASIYKPENNRSVATRYNLPDKFVLYIGDVNYNKNLLNLCAACVDQKITLVIAGKKAVSNEYDHNHVENLPLYNLQTKYGDSKYIRRIGYVDDLDLPNLLKMSLCLCQPSLYEGFGLSVLDAMSLGVPTICGKTQTLVELYEGASMFVDPHSVQNISMGLKEILTNKKLQGILSKNGKIRAKKFLWEKTATETYSIYKKVLKI